MSNLKRYQNPEIFEQLAIEYAVGSLQGRARIRFEVLMETHFYLRAVVDAYENKFAHLVELLPETQPSDKVWKNIETQINAKQTTTVKQTESIAWWKAPFVKQGLGFTAMALILSAVFLLNPMTLTPEATATVYTAVLESANDGPMAITKISRSDMKLSIDIMKKVDIPDDMELTLWCHPKKGGKPMKMGSVSKSGKTMLNISKEEWSSLKNVDMLTVSAEHKNVRIDHPSNEIVLKGKLNPSKETG